MHKGYGLLVVCLAGASAWAQADHPATPEARAAALVSQMTLAEKIGQMQNAAPAIPRLHIPAYDWWNEALHGVARSGLATVFPQAIGLAATWDTDLEHRIADTISTEARAKYNDAIAHDNHHRYFGLTFWSPNINIFRDPRWGRGQETYGEDPYLTSQMALAFIQGMQGSDPRYFKTIATSKHFAVHSGPEASRHQFNANVSPQDLNDTYLYAFRKTLLPGGAYSVMCAYNAVDGAPACASTALLQDTLREAWKFPGYVVSDCGAVGDIYRGHHYADSMAEGAAKAVKAGTDLACGKEYGALEEAVQKGYLQESDIDRAVTRLFVARIRLGMFDPPSQVPFSHIGMDQVASPEHEKLALEAAEKSVVLLKNDNGILPLIKLPKAIAVVGPAADDPDVLLGNYYGTPRHLITPLAGIRQEFTTRAKIQWALGSIYADSSTALVPQSALTAGDDESAQHGVLAEYFNNETFSGKQALSRVEPRGYFVWAMHDPAIMKALPEPSFSVRWTASLRVKFSGDYRLGVARQECDSCLGVNTWRLSLDGKSLIDETHKSAGGHRTMRAPVHLDAGQTYRIRVEYTQHESGAGVELVWAPPADALLQEAVDTVKQADLAIVCIGLNSRLEGEESPIDIPGFAHGDRTDIRLPAQQEKLLAAILDTGKPTIVILLNGSALAINVAKQRAAAILEAWYGGEEGGLAIARTLSGKNNPAGRLPVTFYESLDQLPPFDEYSMKNRTYRYFTGTPLYLFGYGLSYSKFEYSDFAVTPEPGAKSEVSSRVKNVSARDGDEVVEFYLQSPGARELRGFRRIHLKAGESRLIAFDIDSVSLNGKAPSIGGAQLTDASRR
jgi:beta-glucosidase